jgi:hypothetical protein
MILPESAAMAEAPSGMIAANPDAAIANTVLFILSPRLSKP